MYSTRPIRDNEVEGREYFFVSRDYRREMEAKGKVIECRTYHTIAGPWDYFTVDDGQIDLENHDYLMTGTLVSYQKMKEYYGEDVMIPLYIDLDDGLRLERALVERDSSRFLSTKKCVVVFWQMQMIFRKKIWRQPGS